MPSWRRSRFPNCSTWRDRRTATPLRSSRDFLGAVAVAVAALAQRSLAEPPQLTTSPRVVLADTTASSATIVVATDPPAEVMLDWGIGDAGDQHLRSAAAPIHRFTLSQLTAATRYGYRITADGSPQPPRSFHTLPHSGVLRIGVYGDVRGGHVTHRRLVEQMLDEGLDVVAVTGDLVRSGRAPADWTKFFAITGELIASVPYWSAMGNHDLGLEIARATPYEPPSGPRDRPEGSYWYSRDVAGVHLVFLDSNAYDQPEQVAWLTADLAAARRRNVRAILAFTHHGPFSRGYHGGSSLARAQYAPLLAHYRVDYLFSGHDHIYQRGELDGLRYTVTGGGGAPLYTVRCGIDGKPACRDDDGAVTVIREHHYLVVTVNNQLEVCARRVDGRLLEPCQQYPLAR